MQLYAVCINGKKILSAVQASERMSFYAAILSHTSPQRIKRTEQIIYIVSAFCAIIPISSISFQSTLLI